MKRELWFCPSCPQTSTRRWNLKTHIERRHGGIGLPVRRAAQAIQSDTHVNYPEYSPHQQLNYYSQWQVGVDPNMRQRNKPDDIDPFADLNKAQEAANKLAAIKKYYSKLYPPGVVQGIIQMCLNKYSCSFDPAVLDYDLALANKLANFSDTLGKHHGNSNPFQWPSTPNFDARSCAGYVGTPIDAEVNDALKRFERVIRQGSPSSFNSTGNSPSYVQPPSILSFAEFMAQVGPTHDHAHNTDPSVGYAHSPSTMSSSSSFSEVGRDSNTSPPQNNKQSTTGRSTVHSSASHRSARKNHADKNQETSAKLAELETVLSKRLPTQEVARIVNECRDDARIHGHTGVLDHVLRSARRLPS